MSNSPYGPLVNVQCAVNVGSVLEKHLHLSTHSISHGCFKAHDWLPTTAVSLFWLQQFTHSNANVLLRCVCFSPTSLPVDLQSYLNKRHELPKLNL